MSFYSSINRMGNVNEDNDPDYVYYNADIINNSSNDPSTIGDDIIVKFAENRSVPILNNSANFDFSIIRFTMNGCGKNLPILQPTVVIGQNNINLTDYKITINLSKVFVDNSAVSHIFVGYATRNIIYETETTAYIIQNAQLPNPPLVEQDLRGLYYYVYTYDHFSYLVNKTIGLLMKDLQTQYTAYQATFPLPATNTTLVSQPPKLVYDPVSTLFSIYYDVSGWGDATTNNLTGQTNFEEYNMSFNENLFNLLSNFDNNYVGISNLNSQTNKLLVVNNNWTNLYNPPAAPANVTPQPSKYWVMTQNSNSTSTNWSPIASIVFCSTLLPVVSEQIGQPTTYENGSNSGTNTSSSAFQPIITDVALPLSSASDYRGFIQYAPSAEYRISSMSKSKQSLSNIDIQVFWKSNRDNTLYPIRMTNYSNVSIKIMFRKRGL